MTRYYFDLLVDGRRDADTEGTELANSEAARIEATQTMADYAREVLPRAQSTHLTILVRDDRDQQQFTLDLHFTTTMTTP